MMRRVQDEAKVLGNLLGISPLIRAAGATLFPRRGLYAEENDRWRMIFVHIPKTGSTAVQNALFGHATNHVHHSAVQYRSADPVRFAAYYKFCFLREPVDRFLSSYFHYMDGSRLDSHLRWRDRHLAQFANVSDFVRALERPAFRARILSNTHFRPQYEFVCDGRGRTLVDRIYRFEAMEAAFAALSERFAPGRRLERMNASNRTLTAADLDPRERAAIQAIYRRDVALHDGA